LAGAGLTGEEDRDLTRSGLLQQCERGTKGYRRPNEGAQARGRRYWYLVLLTEGFEHEACPTNLQDGALGELRLTHARSVDPSSVGATEVPDPGLAARLDEDLAVKARDGAVRESALVGRMRANLKSIGARLEGDALGSALETAKPEPSDQRGLLARAAHRAR